MVEDNIQQAPQPFDFGGHTFVEPSKRIVAVEDVKRFQEHQSSTELLGFLQKCQKKLINKPMTKTVVTDTVKPVIEWLESLVKILDDIPAVEQPMRFGNKAFKTFISQMNETIDEKLTAFAPDTANFTRAVPELKVYLQESFGSFERIDYGTGHELNFVVFLFCMFKLQVWGENDYECAINCVFQKYMLLIRKIQLQYLLEPAGSHGVWGLDDYQHLAFYFGACQLQSNMDYQPNAIHNEIALRDEDDYMYFGCIRFIKSVKKGVAFGEGSPMLNDISAVPSWDKVANGLFKMFNVEVIGKHPVIKHLKFGSILNFQ